MIGVNVDNLDNLIKKNDAVSTSFNNGSRKLVTAINELNNCYSGSSLNFLFSEPIEEIKNIKTVSEIIESYSNVLKGVRTSYQKQDELLKAQVNHIKSNL